MQHVFSQGEKALETREAFFLRWFKVLERKCAQNDSVDNPRVLLVLEITLYVSYLTAVTCWAEYSAHLI